MADQDMPGADGWGDLSGVVGMGGAAGIHDRVMDALVGDSVREIDLPHAVVCTDRVTGVESFLGPYPSGLAALCAAEAERLLELRHDPGSPTVFTIVPLTPPADR